MTSEPRADLDALRATVRRLGTRMVAIRAIAASDEPDYQCRCDDAADGLRRLLALPDTRPGSWEAEPIRALDDELRGVVRVLEGDDDHGGDR